MFQACKLFKNIGSGLYAILKQQKNQKHVIFNQDIQEHSINLKKVLIVSKLSRYDYEKRKCDENLDCHLDKKHVAKRGETWESLNHYHQVHKIFVEKITNVLARMGIDFEIVNRLTISPEKVDEFDAVIPVGGDGTFLMAASHVLDCRKPVIGFNSNPNRSEGYLCLPSKYSSNIEDALFKLKNGKFKALHRSRIRITLTPDNGDEVVPNYLYPFIGEAALPPLKCGPDRKRVLPVLALNEVFVGEALSARVSHIHLRLDDDDLSTNLKCSGICVATGTGSTSWHMSINRVPRQTVKEILRLAGFKLQELNPQYVNELATRFNQGLTFPPDDSRMGYTIRDIINASVWPQPKGIKPRGFAKKIEIKSRCFDALLVVDGGVAFSFNEGAIANLEIRPEDALRTVIMED